MRPAMRLARQTHRAARAEIKLERLASTFTQDALAAFETAAPGAKDALPTDEHFLPLLMCFGSSLTDDAPITIPGEGFEYGSFSRRSAEQFG